MTDGRKRHRTEDSSPGPSPTPARVQPSETDALMSTASIDTSFGSVHQLAQIVQNPAEAAAESSQELDEPDIHHEDGRGDRSDPFGFNGVVRQRVGPSTSQVRGGLMSRDNPFMVASNVARPRASFVDPNDVYARPAGETPGITPFRAGTSRSWTAVRENAMDEDEDEDEDSMEEDDPTVSKYFRHRKFGVLNPLPAALPTRVPHAVMNEDDSL